MAMTKKEQEILQALTNERLYYKNLLFAVLGIVEVERDVEIPTAGSGDVSQGWDFNVYTNTVYEAWSSSVIHGTGTYREKNHSTQKGIRLFSTKEKAKQALINEAKLKFTSELAQVSRL